VGIAGHGLTGSTSCSIGSRAKDPAFYSCGAQRQGRQGGALPYNRTVYAARCLWGEHAQSKEMPRTSVRILVSIAACVYHHCMPVLRA